VPEVAATIERLVEEHYTEEQKAERQETKQARLSSEIMQHLGPNPLESLMVQAVADNRFDFDFSFFDFDDFQPVGIPWNEGAWNGGTGRSLSPHSQWARDSFAGYYAAQANLQRPNPNQDYTDNQAWSQAYPPAPPHRQNHPGNATSEIAGLLDDFEISLRESQMAYRHLMDGLTARDPHGAHFQLIDDRFRSIGLYPEGGRLVSTFPSQEAGGFTPGTISGGYVGPHVASNWYSLHHSRMEQRRAETRAAWEEQSQQDEIPVRDGPERDSAYRGWGGLGPTPPELESDPELDASLDEFLDYDRLSYPPSYTGALYAQWPPTAVPTYGGHRNRSRRRRARQAPPPPPPPRPRRHRHPYMHSDFPLPSHALPAETNAFPIFNRAVYDEYDGGFYSENAYEYTERHTDTRSVSQRIHHGNHHITTDAQNICVIHQDGTETWVDFAESQGQAGSGQGIPSQGEFSSDDHHGHGHVQTLQRFHHDGGGSTGEGPYSDEEEVEDNGLGVETIQEENYEIAFVVHQCCPHGSHSGNPRDGTHQ